MAGEIDQKGTALALVRLWHTYQLDLAALYRGQIYNTTTYPLSADDVFYICRLLNERQMYYKEIRWLEELVKQIDDGFYTGKANPARAYKTLAGAYFAYGMPWKSEEILTDYLMKDPANLSVKRDKIFYGEKVKSILPEQRTLTLDLPKEDKFKAHYEALCRGDVERPITVTSRLKCFLKKTVIPILFVKEEVLNYDPRVAMLYDVITESEELFIKRIVLNKFTRSGITGNGTKAGGFISDIRISQTAWIHDNVNPVIKKFTHRIEILTGLSTQLYPLFSHAEELQVLNYGIGGMYEPHVDWFGYPLHEFRIPKLDPPQLEGSGERLATCLVYGYPLHLVSEREADPSQLKGTGDRVATWLTYLNSVEAGGATVFTDLNITVPVVKGAAAFWYNLKRNGECDQTTTHAGCPVLIGSKWAANKWIRETGNFFRRKCGKTATSLDGPLS